MQFWSLLDRKVFAEKGRNNYFLLFLLLVSDFSIYTETTLSKHVNTTVLMWQEQPSRYVCMTALRMPFTHSGINTDSLSLPCSVT